MAIYARQLIQALNIESLNLGELLHAALVHDIQEIAEGDLPGPTKRRIVDRSLLNQFETAYVQDRFPDDYPAWSNAGDRTTLLGLVLKVADTLDEVMHLQTESGLGNTTVGSLDDRRMPLGDAVNRLRSAWFVLPLGMKILQHGWLTVIWPAVLAAGPEGADRIIVDDGPAVLADG